MKRFLVVTLALLMIFTASQGLAATQAEYDEVLKQRDALYQQIVDAGLKPVVEIKKSPLETEAPNKASTEYTVKEYRWYDLSYYHNDLLIKNTSGRDSRISVSVFFKDKDGNIIGVGNQIKYACEDGYETFWEFSRVEEFDSVEYEITMKDDNEFICIQSDLDLKVNILKDGAIISVKNIGANPIRFVEYHALFLNKNGEVVGGDYNFLTDIDNEIKPGQTEMRESTCMEAFTEVMAYANGNAET